MSKRTLLWRLFCCKGGVRFVVLGSLCLVSCVYAQPDTLWTRLYPQMTEPAAVKSTPDGGYILAGEIYPLPYRADGSLIKLDSLGYMEWSHMYGLPDNYETFEDVCPMPDGGFLAVGWMYINSPPYPGPDGYAVRVNATGDTVWTRTYDFAYTDKFRSVVPAADGGFLIFGQTAYVGPLDPSGDALLVKLDPEGNVLWQRQHGTSLHDYGMDLVPDLANGGYFATGYIDSLASGGLRKGFFMKVTEQGDSLWWRTYQADRNAYLLALAALPDGFVACGFSYLNDDPDDMLVVRADTVGTVLWHREIGGLDYDRASAVGTLPGGDLIVFGNTDSYGAGDDDDYLVRLTASGDSAWTMTHGGAYTDYCTDGLIAPDGGLTFVGVHRGYGYPSVELVHTATVGLRSSPARPLFSPPMSVFVFPNPFNTDATFAISTEQAGVATVAIYNLTGQRVATLFNGWLTRGTTNLSFAARNLPSGVYLCQFRAGDFTETRKILLLK